MRSSGKVNPRFTSAEEGRHDKKYPKRIGDGKKTLKKRLAVVLASALLASFIAGGFAFPVNVQHIQPLSSSDHPVKPAHLDVVDVQWVIDPSSSTVEGVVLVVKNSDTVDHSFRVVVQVSCLSSGFVSPNFVFSRKPFICAGGSFVTTILPPGATLVVPVDFDNAVEPERTQIEDLSFIVAEDPLAGLVGP